MDWFTLKNKQKYDNNTSIKKYKIKRDREVNQQQQSVV